MLFLGAIAKWATKTSVSAADDLPAPSPIPIAPIPPTPTGDPAGQPPAPFAADDKGFINSNARCEGTQSALAIGRTERSLVVICPAQNGKYEYLGVRLSDDAVLKTPAETAPTRGFLAHNDRVTYAVSPTELVVTAGDTVIKHEPMIEYREPTTVHAAAAAAPPGR